MVRELATEASEEMLLMLIDTTEAEDRRHRRLGMRLMNTGKTIVLGKEAKLIECKLL